VNESSCVVVAIPALGSLILAIAAQRTQTTGTAEEHASLFRRIAGIFAVCTLVAIAGLSLFGRAFHLKIGFGGNDVSAAFGLLTAAAWLPAISVARRSERTRPALLYGLLLLLEASYLAIFACDSALWLCGALEVNTVLLYLLMVGWSAPASEGLAKKMLMVNLVADMAILIGLLGVVIASARVSATEPHVMPRLTYSLGEIVTDLPHETTDDVSAQEYWKHAQRALVTILILGAALKTPLVPFHAWFTAAVAEGPLCAGIALVAAGSRIGLYLLARFIGPLCGDLGGVADLLVGLAVLGTFLQSVLTYGQLDFKKMLACVCLLQGSLAVAGFFSMRPENASGPLMLSLAGGVAGTLVLYSLGVLEIRLGTPATGDIGGIVHKLPNLAAVFLIATFSLVGIPGLFGFPGLFSTLGSIFSGEWTFAFLAIASCLIGAWALFSMLQHLVFGSLRLPLPGEVDVLIVGTPSDAAPGEWSIVTQGQSASIDLGTRELLILGPLLATLVALGIWPQAIATVLHLALIGSSSP
jgi:NADH-quinone oxidoreductase subunit M